MGRARFAENDKRVGPRTLNKLRCLRCGRRLGGIWDPPGFEDLETEYDAGDQEQPTDTYPKFAECCGIEYCARPEIIRIQVLGLQEVATALPADVLSELKKLRGEVETLRKKEEKEE